VAQIVISIALRVELLLLDDGAQEVSLAVSEQILMMEQLANVAAV